MPSFRCTTILLPTSLPRPPPPKPNSDSCSGRCSQVTIPVWLRGQSPPPGLEQLPAGSRAASKGLLAASRPTPSFSQLTPAEPHSPLGRSPGASPCILLPGKGADLPLWLMDAPPCPPPRLPLLPVPTPCSPFLSHPRIPATAIPTLAQILNSNIRGLEGDLHLSRTARLAWSQNPTES